VYQAEVTLNGRRLHPVVVDTGDGSSVTVTAAEWAAARPPGQKETTSIGYGLGGAVETGLAILPQIGVGRLTARNVEVRIEPAGGFSEGIGAAGRIGSGFLGRYRVLLDPRAGHMVFRPGPDADKPPLRSTSGLLLALARDRLRVLHVMRGSPAAQAGWKAGEEICAVDGRTIGPDYATDPTATWTAGTPGRTVRLTGCQPGATPRPLTLRTFY
jgi:S1-C subfamily serine protease